MRTWTFPEIHPWVDGPWVDEPDKAQWVDEATGLDCLIVRNHAGALCGYVGLPPGHRLHGVNYDDIYDMPVHGGLTFSSRCAEGAEDGPGICHVPEEGRPADVWWFGFDCAHARDLVPAYLVEGMSPYITKDCVYRDFAYVQAEVTDLARQLADAGKAKATMPNHDRIRIGGLMRCCLQTIRKREKPGDEGVEQPCRWCSSVAIFRDGAWEWKQRSPRHA